jgi:murein DD-endopeptidase MepM/ murein hydrolase activator NlpD
MRLWKWRLMWALILLLGGALMFSGQILTTIMLAGYATQVRSESYGGCVQPGTQKPVTVTNGSKASADKVANAKAIDQAAQKAGLSGYASRIAIIAAMGESNLVNLDYGDQVHGVRNPDGSLATSFGLFQQQTSQGWGTKEQVMDPEYAATSFFLGPKHDGKGGLVSVPNWENETWISNVIHRVQRNSVADHYTKWIPFADRIISEAGIDIHRAATRKAAELPDIDSVVNPGKAGCEGGKGGVTIGDLKGGWANPLPGAQLSSGYGPRATPAGTRDFGAFHYGLDLSTPGPVGGTIYAVADMKIVIATGEDKGTGAGTHVKAQTMDGKLTIAMYHMLPGSLKVKAGDTVAAGTPLGTEGSSGNSQGHHLHIEFYKGAIPDPWPQTAPVADPCPIMENKVAGFSCEIGAIEGDATAASFPGFGSGQVFALAASTTPGPGGVCTAGGCGCGCGRTGARYTRMAA